MYRNDSYGRGRTAFLFWQNKQQTRAYFLENKKLFCLVEHLQCPAALVGQQALVNLAFQEEHMAVERFGGAFLAPRYRAFVWELTGYKVKSGKVRFGILGLFGV